MNIYTAQVILHVIAILTEVMRISRKQSIQHSGRTAFSLIDCPTECTYRFMFYILLQTRREGLNQRVLGSPKILSASIQAMTETEFSFLCGYVKA